jgi:hypothetical protein|tara:strand:+ start:2224 stop:2421 length:198 start_codon:yes stop_codon:yes gene_type:complete
MKLTKSQIKQIIKEELEAVMMEMEDEAIEEEEVLEQKGGLKYDEAAAVAELQAKMAEPMTRSRRK